MALPGSFRRISKVVYNVDQKNHITNQALTENGRCIVFMELRLDKTVLNTCQIIEFLDYDTDVFGSFPWTHVCRFVKICNVRNQILFLEVLKNAVGVVKM